MTNNQDSLAPICDGIQTQLNTKNNARDRAISQSRELIRHCAETIRAIHRREWTTADEKLAVVQQGADALRAVVSEQPDLYFSGYTQDALKEVVEAHITYAIIRDTSLPTPDQLQVEGATYLKGLGEAATELRRFILDIMRRQEHHSDEAERLLNWMDAIYDQLITFDFPDAITYGLRRQTDVVRGVLERTRGDLTHSLRQQRLQNAISAFEQRIMQDTDAQVQTLLVQLHDMVRDTPASRDDVSQKMDELQEDLREQIEGPDDVPSPYLIDRMNEAVALFEADHPELAYQIRRIIQTLSNAGV